MNELAIKPAQEMTRHDITAAAFSEFISFVDRSPRTARAYTVNFRAFCAWMIYAGVKHPTRQDVIAYRNWLQAPHEALTGSGDIRRDKHGAPIIATCKPATIRAYMQSVKMFFKWAAANGYYPDIAANIHTPKLSKHHKKDALTAGDVAAIERSITAAGTEKMEAARHALKDSAGRIDRATEQGKRLYAIFSLAVNAGLRTIEISRANVGDFERKGNQSYIYIFGKGHTEADIKKPIAPEVAAAIQDYLDSRQDVTAGAPLFTATGNRSGGKRLATTTISTMIKRALVYAGYDSKRLTAHSLRHTTAAAVMAVSDYNIQDTKDYMRHTNPATTEIYLDGISEERNANIAARVYDYYHGKETTGGLEKLMRAAQGLTAEQLEQLATIATAFKTSN